MSNNVPHVQSYVSIDKLIAVLTKYVFNDGLQVALPTDLNGILHQLSKLNTCQAISTDIFLHNDFPNDLHNGLNNGLHGLHNGVHNDLHDDSHIDLHNVLRNDLNNDLPCSNAIITNIPNNSPNDVLQLAELTNKPGLKIGCLNIRGLLNKIDEIRIMLKNCQFDLMCLCETFLDNNVADYEFKIERYAVALRNRDKRGGGVLMYIKDSINYSEITNLTGSSVESIWINIKNDKKSLAIGMMYRPPSSNVAYFNAILDQVDQIYTNHDNVILLGDLN